MRFLWQMWQNNSVIFKKENPFNPYFKFEFVCFLWHCCIMYVCIFGVLFLQDLFLFGNLYSFSALESQRKQSRTCVYLCVHYLSMLLQLPSQNEDKVLQSCKPYWGEGYLQVSLPTSLYSRTQHPGEMDYVHVKQAWPEAQGQSLNWELNNLLALCANSMTGSAYQLFKLISHEVVYQTMDADRKTKQNKTKKSYTTGNWETHLV